MAVTPGTFRSVCPKCGNPYRMPNAALGKRARCRQCNHIFIVRPERHVLEESVADWLSSSADSEDTGTPIQMESGGSESQELAEAVVSQSGQVAAAEPSPRVAPTQNLPATAPPKPPTERVRSAQTVRLPVELDRVDTMGAYFLFPSRLLREPRLRTAFPARCVACCGDADLEVHLVTWPSKLMDARESEQRSLLTWRSLGNAAGRDLLNKIPNQPNLPPPYKVPLPYFVCKHCSSLAEVWTHVATRDNIEWCEMGIANIEIAMEFFANCGWKGSRGYQRLDERKVELKDDPWERLQLAARNRIKTWFVPEKNETFLAYLPDREFAKTELGMAGLVLTDRRLCFKKYASERQFDLTKPLVLQAQSEEEQVLLKMTAKGSAPAKVVLDPHDYNLLRSTATEQSETLEFKDI